MKKIILLFGIVLGTLLLTGCDGNVTRDIRHAGFGLSQEEFVCTNPQCKRRGEKINADFNAARNIAMSKKIVER